MTFAGVLAVIIGSYGAVFADLIHTWFYDPDYSHGVFVIPVTAYIMYARRRSMPRTLYFSWAGAALFAFGLLLRILGIALSVVPLEHFSLLCVIAGVVWMLGGGALFRWSLPGLIYLLFMVRLPHFLAVRWSQPLQAFSAKSAAYLLQTMGIASLAEGNVIQLENERLDVAFACSGLQMMVAFMAVTAAMALLSEFPLLGRLALFLTAIPIAMFCNTIRIAATAIGFRFFEAASVRGVVHDFGGFAFIPIAIGLVMLELWLFNKAFPRLPIEFDPEREVDYYNPTSQTT